MQPKYPHDEPSDIYLGSEDHGAGEPWWYDLYYRPSAKSTVLRDDEFPARVYSITGGLPRYVDSPAASAFLLAVRKGLIDKADLDIALSEHLRLFPDDPFQLGAPQ